MPTITFDASNELPPPRRMTLVGVDGEGFQPHTEVNIGIFLGTSQRAIAHAVVHAGANGSFSWGSAISPRRACNTALLAVVHDTDGSEFRAAAEVFCP